MGEASLEDCRYLRPGNPSLGTTSDEPDFFVVDDQYNDTDRDHRVESGPKNLKPGLLKALTTMLTDTNKWMIYLAVQSGGLAIRSDRIEYSGDLFEGCKTIADIELRCRPVL